VITTFEYENHKYILRFSPLVIKPGHRPSRIVLRKLGDAKWVTHLETLGLDGSTWKHDGFHNGHYFEVMEDGVTSEEFQRLCGAEFERACVDYNERCAKL
jgi:hypothetical protein